jgi:hypothetical protein
MCVYYEAEKVKCIVTNCVYLENDFLSSLFAAIASPSLSLSLSLRHTKKTFFLTSQQKFIFMCACVYVSYVVVGNDGNNNKAAKGVKGVGS